ncbi:GDSL-type esterase/lipase family protein [Paenibacillus lemnae]|uniref:Lysophospholipase n=1 Tax=Paenibacillus lemnae TaxID=1330551 RepID=A0A848M783_PAELE|nr:GDSL-type esterase/lipase family protein [Paenibacillus lemnae]NMO96496.1 lysophospholipase [Paenibacillus lemnae]
MVYNYTAVGDSLTFGIGALPGSGFVPLYRRYAEDHLQKFVAYENLGVLGLTSSALHDRVLHHPVFREHLKSAQIITVSVGGNDLIRAVKMSGGRADHAALDQALARSRVHLSGIVREIRRLKTGSTDPYILRAVGLYNPYPSWSEAAGYVNRMNQFLGNLVPTAEIYDLFLGQERELLSLDGVHPNTKGHRVIAEQLNAMGFVSLHH